MSSSEETFLLTSINEKPAKSLCAIRYNFLPDSVDKGPGTISIYKSGEVNAKFSVSSATKSSQNSSGIEKFYSGNCSKAKEFEFVLIVDGKTKTARIEKVCQSISLRNVRRSRRLSSGNDAESSKTDENSAEEASCGGADEEVERLSDEIFKDFK